MTVYRPAERVKSRYPELIVGLTVVVLVAGAVNGLAGVGVASVGTIALATATAVAFMIGPILGGLGIA